MKWSWFGRAAMAFVSAIALGLSMTACGGTTIAYLWVIGQQYNQITGFKVDNNTGNLTQIPGAPFASGGSNPVHLVLKSGGRYVYVVNQGANVTSTSNGAGSGIQSFAVGGDGTLTPEISYDTQGFGHLWAQFDNSGAFLYVLDKYSPDYKTTGNGSITTYSSDPSTGRLILIQQTASTPSGGTAPEYVDVGGNPLQMFSTGSCLFTLNQADQSISAFTVTSGQLAPATTGKIFPQTTRATSINGNSSNVFITDAGSNRIFPFTVGTGCSLTTYTGGSTPNDVSASNPQNSFIDNNGKFLFVLNQSTTSTAAQTPFSSITVFSISNGQLVEIAGSPYKSGSGPVCMVEDPTNKYVYVSNFNDGTITGYTFTNTQGTLSDLSRGSTFTAAGKAQCLILSGSVT